MLAMERKEDAKMLYMTGEKNLLPTTVPADQQPKEDTVAES